MIEYQWRDFLESIWIEWRCPSCLRDQPIREIGLKYRLVEVMQDGGTAECPSCETIQRLGGIGPDFVADATLWATLDGTWQRVCDILESLEARLTVPPI